MKTAFLYKEINEEIYTLSPEVYEYKSKVFELKKLTRSKIITNELE